MLRQSRRGFSLIEMSLAVIMLSVMILASGGVLVFLARGQIESRNDADAQNRIELVRQLIGNDVRQGSSVMLPSSSGGTGTEFQVQTVFYNATTDSSTNLRYRWAWDSSTLILTRYVATETSPGSGVYGSETSTFTQPSISSFSVTRFNDGDGVAWNDIRMDFSIGTTESTESGSLAFTTTLRNVR